MISKIDDVVVEDQDDAFSNSDIENDQAVIEVVSSSRELISPLIGCVKHHDESCASSPKYVVVPQSHKEAIRK